MLKKLERSEVRSPVTKLLRPAEQLAGAEPSSTSNLGGDCAVLSFLLRNLLHLRRSGRTIQTTISGNLTVELAAVVDDIVEGFENPV
jgi:hypothetical protein